MNNFGRRPLHATYASLALMFFGFAVDHTHTVVKTTTSSNVSTRSCLSELVPHSTRAIRVVRNCPTLRLGRSQLFGNGIRKLSCPDPPD
ncbi:uncharacterized protein EV422DRAFT_519675 [Fimicolochytrium jonesii]|uniref:uncharacterized protein n=1 Tax=Fimicolochytrium jonesii TaxID=1396493 RepID=UPI0022FE5DF3|nr:uncharacterized protein EV422DRAFT_519675 [Fimicolochytrium jonesii]KAI8824306.1 hypothetical protein EV422DRAFT_519675 [Fimicolochytrium jonesii]